MMKKYLFCLIIAGLIAMSASAEAYAKDVVNNPPKAVRMMGTLGERGLTTFISYFAGSGFYIKGGYVISSAHMVTNEKTQFDIDDGTNRSPVTLIAIDRMRDLALFEVTDYIEHGYFEIAESVSDKDLLTTISNTSERMFEKKPGNILTLSKHAPIVDRKTWRVISYNARMIVNISSTGGNSGSPVLNKEGKVVGVVIAYMKKVEDDTKGDAVCATLEDVKEFIRKEVPAANVKLADR